MFKVGDLVFSKANTGYKNGWIIVKINKDKTCELKCNDPDDPKVYKNVKLNVIFKLEE